MSIYIIAEIGINHNGDMKIAKELIDIAAYEGCNAVKFQKRDIDQVYTQEFLDSDRIANVYICFTRLQVTLMLKIDLEV